MRLRGSTPAAEAIALLEAAQSDLGAAIMLIKHGQSGDDKTAAFRLLAGVQGAAESVKLALTR